MHIRAFIAAAVMAVMSTAVMAGPLWNAGSAIAENEWSVEYAVPDFTLTRDEFGGNDFSALAHLAVEAGFEAVVGFNVVYNPAADAYDVFVMTSQGDDHNPGVISNKHCTALAADHPKRRTGGYCDYATSNATLAPSSGGLAFSHTVAATLRECTFALDLPDAHGHTC